MWSRSIFPHLLQLDVFLQQRGFHSPRRYTAILASFFKVLRIPRPPTWRLCSSGVLGRLIHWPWCQKPTDGGSLALEEEAVEFSLTSSPAVVLFS